MVSVLVDLELISITLGSRLEILHLLGHQTVATLHLHTYSHLGASLCSYWLFSVQVQWHDTRDPAPPILVKCMSNAM